jgi:protein-S-isoprenylcysteine O-methyltransferase Ste14
VQIPPLAVVAATGLAMWLVTRALPGLRFDLPGRSVVAGTLAAVGVVVCVAGVVEFRRAGTTVNPLRPDAVSSLVSGGIYRYTRNPMYLGFALVLLGWAALLAHPLALFGVPAYVVWADRTQIPREERSLAALFGDEFARYCARVRRWL